MPDTPKGPLPDRGSTGDANRERAMLERHLLVRRRGHEPLFPGLWADDRWIPGIALADTWAPVWAAPGMPFLGRVPLRFTSAHVVAALGIGTPPKLSSRQRKEWAAAGREPARTWQDACDLPIDHPGVSLLTSRVLDDLAREHGEAPRRAREVHAKVRGAIDALRAIQGVGTELGGRVATPEAGPWRVGTLGRLLDLYNRDAAVSLLLFEVAGLIGALERWDRDVVRLAAVEHAFLPPRGKTRDYERWSGAAARLDEFLRSRGGGKTSHLAIVAGLEWHGHDLGPGSLA
jgi:hypothetical protein